MAKYGMLLDLSRCIGCHTCEIACKMCYGTRPGVDYGKVKYVEWGEYPEARQAYQLNMCMHCENAPCISVCPVGATYKTEEGPVVVDYDKCIGCGLCVQNCPYGARYLVEDDETSFEGQVMVYEEESAQRLKVVEKCTMCYARAQAGLNPMCTDHCPGRCRIFGDVEDAGSDISKAIAERNATQVEGTSIWYVAPADMPAELLPVGLAEACAAAGITLPDAPAPTPEPTADPTASAAPVAPSGEEKGGVSGGVVAGIVAGAAVIAGGVAAYANKSKKKDENKEVGKDA